MYTNSIKGNEKQDFIRAFIAESSFFAPHHHNQHIEEDEEEGYLQKLKAFVFNAWGWLEQRAMMSKQLCF